MKTLTRHTTSSSQLSQLTPCGDHAGKFSDEAYKCFQLYDEELSQVIHHHRGLAWSDIMTDGTKVYAVWAGSQQALKNGRALLLELEYSDCEEAFDQASVLYENILETLRNVASEGRHVCDTFGNFGEFAEANGGYDPDFCKVVFNQNADELEAIYKEATNN